MPGARDEETDEHRQGDRRGHDGNADVIGARHLRRGRHQIATGRREGGKTKRAPAQRVDEASGEANEERALRRPPEVLPVPRLAPAMKIR